LDVHVVERRYAVDTEEPQPDAVIHSLAMMRLLHWLQALQQGLSVLAAQMC
jgi:hypothetical protein